MCICTLSTSGDPGLRGNQVGRSDRLFCCAATGRASPSDALDGRPQQGKGQETTDPRDSAAVGKVLFGSDH